jgi:hypothetical protein
MAMDAVRVWSRIPTEKYEKMSQWAEQLGMSVASFVAVTSWVGARQVMRTLEPETFFTTEQWGEVIASAMRSLPDADVEVIRARLQEAAGEETVGGVLPDA